MDSNVSPRSAPWALILQVLLIVLWYALPGMQSASAWVIFMPTLICAGLVLVYFLAGLCVLIAAVVKSRRKA